MDDSFARVRSVVTYWLQSEYKDDFPLFEPEASTKMIPEYFLWLTSEITQALFDRPRVQEVTAYLHAGKNPWEIMALLARDSLEEMKKARRVETIKAPLEMEMMVTASQEQFDEAEIGAKVLAEGLKGTKYERT